MTTEINMPRLSETMSDGKIVSWNKKAGDRVNKGDTIAEVETDKATMEIEAVDTGTLSEILVNEGSIAKVGETIAVLDGKRKAAAEKPKAQEPEEEKPVKKTKEIKEEKPPEAKKEKIEKEEPVKKEPSTAKMEYSPEMVEEKEYKPKQEPQKPQEKEILKSTPGARKLAKEKGIDLSLVEGTGPGGRISEENVQSFINADISKKEEQQEEKPDTRTEPLSRMRQTIATRMVESKQNIPHFYVTYEINADKLVEFEQKAKKKIKGLTFNDIFLKAIALTLKKHPMFNAEFRGDHILINENVNIGIAVAIEKGLLVPVIHDCDKKNLEEISQSAQDLKSKIKNNKLTPEDMGGGTFTVSNMGMLGVRDFIAIINPPESAALAIGAIMRMPVVENNDIKIGNIVNLTLSADHRVVDGAAAARFMIDLKNILENPDEIKAV
ncbi:MAG: hypothetical protein ACD_20C00418G0005 [uncultured bacterium]|nr:MAG: hypothetical protein ACD_20C00418G0005 [uncultured bacterium]HBH18111.1 dihydrolipoamide acyltransferase [Cyanobacteria bacterium UBA9579]